MNLHEYQALAMRTCPAMGNGDMIGNAALGLAGEAGEVADIVKKHLYQGHALNKDKVAEEVGDILWYCALAATALECDLGDIAQHNIRKLQRRYPQGFDTLRSQNRGPENWCGEQALEEGDA
jgi:NTP pyrophosphatase (non-canonical NTP hydrolase)